jgi:predicted nucleotidyltransferase
MTPDLPPSIRRLIDYGIQSVDPDRIILFGSRARGDAREGSDFDLAFDFPSTQKHQWLKFLAEANDLPLTLRPTDLVDIHEASPDLRECIITEGVLIYERPEKT